MTKHRWTLHASRCAFYTEPCSPVLKSKGRTSRTGTQPEAPGTFVFDRKLVRPVQRPDRRSRQPLWQIQPQRQTGIPIPKQAKGDDP
jgi:hypothetical protein